MIVYDDFWQACKAMPAEDAKDFLYALCAYAFDGVEPSGAPSWLPVYIVVKDRVDMSGKASSRAKTAANARWGKRSMHARSDSSSEHDAERMHEHADASCGIDASASCNGDASASAPHDAESESESESESKEPSSGREADRASEVTAEVVRYLNRASGKSFVPTSRKTRSLVSARLGEGYDVDDFKAVIDVKCSEWLGDGRMERFVRPETLFGTKFESYLNEKGADDGRRDWGYNPWGDAGGDAARDGGDLGGGSPEGGGGRPGEGQGRPGAPQGVAVGNP